MTEKLSELREVNGSILPGDGPKFMDFMKEDNVKDFVESLKEDKSAVKDFVESLKEDKSAVKDFVESLKKDKNKEATEVANKQPFADNPLGKMSEDKNFDKPVSAKKESKPLMPDLDPKDAQRYETPPWETSWNPYSELKTRNEDLEGKKHPETGVPYVRKTVKDAAGNPVEGVFPEFNSQFDVQLPEDLYQASDSKQARECNKQLKEAVEKDPELAKKFTPEQLEQIKNGDTPDGYTWHHNEETGKMQLVDTETHAKTPHTGGKVIWGGGQENR
jgi:hypothetical protein